MTFGNSMPNSKYSTNSVFCAMTDGIASLNYSNNVG